MEERMLGTKCPGAPRIEMLNEIEKDTYGAIKRRVEI